MGKNIVIYSAGLAFQMASVGSREVLKRLLHALLHDVIINMSQKQYHTDDGFVRVP